MFAMTLIAAVAIGQAAPTPKDLADFGEGDLKEVYIGLYEADQWTSRMVNDHSKRVSYLWGVAYFRECDIVQGFAWDSVCQRFKIGRKSAGYIWARGEKGRWNLMKECQEAVPKGAAFKVFRPHDVRLPAALAKALGHKNPEPAGPPAPRRGQP